MLMLVKLFKPMMTKQICNKFFPVCFTENIWIVIKIRWKFIIGRSALCQTELFKFFKVPFMQSGWREAGCRCYFMHQHSCENVLVLYAVFSLFSIDVVVIWIAERILRQWKWNNHKLCNTIKFFRTEYAWRAFRGLIIIHQFVLIILVHGHDSTVHHSPWTNLLHFQFDLINWILIKFQFLDYYFQGKYPKKRIQLNIKLQSN